MFNGYTGEVGDLLTQPVNRLNKVVLPEFGGPTTAMVRKPFLQRSFRRSEGPARSWTVPSLLHRTGEGTNYDAAGDIAAQGNFDAVDAVDTGITTGAAASGDNFNPRNEAEVHQMIGNARGEIEMLEDCGLTFLKVGKSGIPGICEVENHFQFHLRL